MGRCAQIHSTRVAMHLWFKHNLNRCNIGDLKGDFDPKESVGRSQDRGQIHGVGFRKSLHQTPGRKTETLVILVSLLHPHMRLGI